VSKEPGIACWFCDERIETTDREAVEVSVRNLWSTDDDATVQTLYLHSICAAERLQGKGMKFELDWFTDPN
jgi:hypothetical protein